MYVYEIRFTLPTGETHTFITTADSLTDCLFKFGAYVLEKFGTSNVRVTELKIDGK